MAHFWKDDDEDLSGNLHDNDNDDDDDDTGRDTDCAVYRHILSI